MNSVDAGEHSSIGADVPEDYQGSSQELRRMRVETTLKFQFPNHGATTGVESP